MIVYEKITDPQADVTGWIAYDDRYPNLYGTGQNCNQALDDLTKKLRAIIHAVLLTQKPECEE